MLRRMSRNLTQSDPLAGDMHLPKPLVAHYDRFSKTRREEALAAIHERLQSVKGVKGFRKWLRRFQSQNKPFNIWPYLSELAIASHLLKHVEEVGFLDQTGQAGSCPPDFKVSVDGCPVWIEAKILWPEFAAGMKADDLIREARNKLETLQPKMRLGDNWLERTETIAKIYSESRQAMGEARKLFEKEVCCMGRVLATADFSNIKEGSVFNGQILKVWIEDVSVRKRITCCSTPCPSGSKLLKQILQDNICYKAQKKDTLGKRPYAIFIDVGYFILFQTEWDRLVRWGQAQFQVPSNIDYVVILGTDYSWGQSIDPVQAFHLAGDANGTMAKLFPRPQTTTSAGQD
jgi:hypothetical protein